MGHYMGLMAGVSPCQSPMLVNNPIHIGDINLLMALSQRDKSLTLEVLAPIPCMHSMQPAPHCTHSSPCRYGLV